MNLNETITLRRLMKPIRCTMVLLISWVGLSGMLYAQSVLTTDHVRAELVAHAPNGLAPGRPAGMRGKEVQFFPKNAGRRGR